ncbi:hypothetical protein EVAR_31805_1 [Eumeta japonica]|uniref:Uncharacterized protein n=1 Tax=Eumeta variegata TaxID=151549 RepID=A0A4C1W3J6_EUMVA|nr:hypothetical protein EVAR_31805_1 [Eumeta japonica]
MGRLIRARSKPARHTRARGPISTLERETAQDRWYENGREVEEAVVGLIRDILAHSGYPELIWHLAAGAGGRGRRGEGQNQSMFVNSRFNSASFNNYGGRCHRRARRGRAGARLSMLIPINARKNNYSN